MSADESESSKILLMSWEAALKDEMSANSLASVFGTPCELVRISSRDICSARNQKEILDLSYLLHDQIVYLKRLRLSRFVSVGAAVSGRALQYRLHTLFLGLLDNPSFYCCRVG